MQIAGGRSPAKKLETSCRIGGVPFVLVT